MKSDYDIVRRILQTDLSNPENLKNLWYIARMREDYELNRFIWQKASHEARETRDPEFVKLYRNALLFGARARFEEYLLYMELDRQPEKRFYLPRRKQLKPIVDAMQDMVDDKVDLLCVSMPPGTGKSTLGLFFLSWIIGMYPDKCNLASAHSDRLTKNFYTGVYNLITDTEYKWREIFFQNSIYKSSADDESIDLNRYHRFPTLTCRAIGGTLTGATRCEMILYADDLCSGIEEALNKNRLDKLWQSYNSDLKSRKKTGCKEIHIATRWSVHDVIGRLEDLYYGTERARFITMPALNERGESNFDYEYEVGFSTDYFIDMKESLDDLTWRALFMNEPIEREGLLYSEEELRRYYELPTEQPDGIMAVVDTAEGGGDDTVLLVGYLYGNDIYIDDCVCSDALPEVTNVLCANMLLQHNVQKCRIESNSAGGRAADEIQRIVKEHGGRTHITKKWSTGHKQTKIIMNSDFVKEHMLFKDDRVLHRGDMYSAMIKKMCNYTLLGRNPHDDVVDAMAQLALYIQDLSLGEIVYIKKPF